jgi:hypothetical protein
MLDCRNAMKSHIYLRNFCVMLAVIIVNGPSRLSVAADQASSKGRDIRKFGLIALAYRDAVKRMTQDEDAFRREWFTKEDWSHPLPPPPREQDIVSFHTEISYGDMTGDGNEAAAVGYHYHVGEFSSVNFSGVLLYAFRNGRPELVAHVNGGDLAYGGIKSAVICGCLVPELEHRLVVERYKPSEKGCHSCYGYIERTVYKLKANKLVDVDKKVEPIAESEAAGPVTTPSP